MKQRFLWSRRESNPYLEFRKLLFYPLNYGTIPNYDFRFTISDLCANVQIIVGLVKPSFAHPHIYLITDPLLKSSAGATKLSLPSAFSAINIIPCDVMPFISRGSRFTRMLTFWPIMASRPAGFWT